MVYFVSGINEALQLQILTDMEEVTKNMFFLNNKGRLVQQPFQTGIPVSIKSIKNLYQELKSEGVSFMLTSKVNQGTLENHFSGVRYVSGSDSHPTASMFSDRIKMLCVSKILKLYTFRVQDMYGYELVNNTGITM